MDEAIATTLEGTCRAVSAPTERKETEPEARRDGRVVLGKLTALGASGAVWIHLADRLGPRTVRARTAAVVRAEDLGRDVAVLFEGGDPRKPLVVGVVAPSVESRGVKGGPSDGPAEAWRAIEFDGERLTIAAEKEIVLRCGRASITLTRAGKVLIRGAYLLSRSSGVNRIQGGSVQIN